MNTKTIVKAVLTAGIATLLLTLTACGPSPSVPGLPGGNAGGGKSFTVDYTDQNGYSYKINWTVPKTLMKADPTNAKPGETEIFVTAGVLVTIKNTTPGRNAFSLDLNLSPVYAKSAAAATSSSRRCSSFSEFTDNRIPDNDYCALYGFSYEHVAPDIPVNQSQKLNLTWNTIGNLVSTINENDAKTVLDSLNQPAGWVLRQGIQIIWSSPELNLPPA